MIKLLTRNLFKGAQAKATATTYNFAKDIPKSEERIRQNLFMAVNSAIDIALETDPTYIKPHTAPKSSAKTSSLAASSAAPPTSAKSMVLTESSILLCLNRASLVLLLEQQWPETPLSPKFSLVTTYSQLSTKLSMKQPSIGIVREDSSSVVDLLSEPPGVQSAMAHSITLSLLKPTLHTLLDSK